MPHTHTSPPPLALPILSLPLPFQGPRKTQPQAVVLHCLGYSTPRLGLWQLFACQVSAHFFVLQMGFDAFLQHIHSPLSARESGVFSRLGPQGQRWWQEAKARIHAAHPQDRTSPLVIQLVDPSHNAWHAGISRFGQLPRLGQSLNHSTIGIEMHIPGYDGAYGWGGFCTAGQDTLARLVAQLCHQWAIDPRAIVAHSTIAPNRRTDPGLAFSWTHLASKGFGYQPPIPHYPHDLLSPQAVPAQALGGGTVSGQIKRAQELLVSLGFDCPRTASWDGHWQYCLNAYRLQFYPRGRIAPIPLAPAGSLTHRLAKPDPTTITPGVLWAMTTQLNDDQYPAFFRPA